MDRSLYPNGCIVDQVALRRTETSKANEILRGRTDWTSRGVYTGGEITVNAVDDTKVDVAQFGGFAPNGEYIASTSDYFSISLSDYTLNTVNLLVAVYCENYKNNVPHETDGESYPSYAEASLRVRAYTEAEYVALPTTDANLANDAQDRCLILGKITANGAGVSLTDSSIQSPTEYNNILYATPLVPTTITGVTILGVSSGTATGDGTLEYYIDGMSNKYVRWNSSSSTWAAVAPPGTGWEYFTSDEIRSIPDPSGEYVRIQVVVSELPTSIVQETITITNLYYQEIPRLTAEDVLHRNLQGTGTPTPQNPHGMSLSDFTDSDLALLNEHQDVMHSNGIWKSSNMSCMECTVSFPVAGDQLNITEPTSSDLYYINGVKLNTIDTSSFLFIPSVVPTSASGVHFYEVSVSDSGSTAVNLKMSFTTRTITGVWIVGSSESYPAGTYSLALTVSGATSYAFSWDSGETVTVTSSMDSQVIRLYAENNTDWIDLLVNINDASGDPDGQPLAALGAYSDTITVYSSLDWSQHLHLCSVCGWWNASGGPARFQIGYKPYEVSRSVVDTRIWGTLAVDNLSDSVLQETAYYPQDELHESGVLYRRNTTYYDFDDYGASGLSIMIRGGSYYCRGERISFSGDSTLLTDNAVNLVYLDYQGNLLVLDVTSDFAGDVEDALAYVIGSTKLTPPNNAVYHATDLVDPPERGVALYQITTSGGSITGTVNLMRNVNGPIYSWSVAAFGSGYLSAFDSLYTAFLYANVQSYNHSIDVKIVGPSYVDTTITQPAKVSVTSDSRLSGYVQIRYVDASGAWRLTQGCCVKNVLITTALNSVVAIGLAEAICVEGCYYISSASSTDTFLYSSSAVTYSYICDNFVNTRSCFVEATSSSNDNLYIMRNTVSQLPNGSSTNLIHVNGKNVFISDNYINTDNSTTSTPAIYGVVSGEYTINGNTIALGTSSDTGFDYGIYLDTTSYSPKIFGNTIKRESGSSSHVGIGIYIVDGGAHIKNNIFSEMGEGVEIESDDLTNITIQNNTFISCYHRGVRVHYSSSANTSLSNISICSNSFANMVKNAGGSGGGLFGTHLYAVYLSFISATNANFGSICIDNNIIDSLSNSVGGYTGAIYMAFTFSTGGGVITSGLENVSISSNSIRDLSSSSSYSYGIRVLVGSSGANASTLLMKNYSLCNNNIKSVSALSGNAYGINTAFSVASLHTSLLEGFNVCGNNVSGFYGENVAAGEAMGISVDDSGPISSIFGFSCSNNTIGTVSNNTTGSGTDNDATYVCGIFNSLKNSVISNNSITINGFGGTLSTARGDGIRLFAYGITPPTIRSVVSGNVIQVNWAGIHAKSSLANALFDIHGNRINSGSIGVYLDAGLEGCLISDNSIYVTATNDWEDTGCNLTGAACIANQPSSGDASVISGNNLYLIGSSNTYSANVWADSIPGINIDGNRTMQGGAVVNDVYHIRAYNCTGSCSVSGNTIDNSSRSGANGIFVHNTADTFTNFSVLNNNIRGANVFGSGIYECYVNAFFGGGATSLQAFVLGNTVKVNVGAGATPNTYVGGSAVNYYGTTTTDYDNVKVASDTTVTRW